MNWIITHLQKILNKKTTLNIWHVTQYMRCFNFNGRGVYVRFDCACLSTVISFHAKVSEYRHLVYVGQYQLSQLYNLSNKLLLLLLNTNNNNSHCLLYFINYIYNTRDNLHILLYTHLNLESDPLMNSETNL